MNIGFFTDSYFPQVNGVTYTVELWRRKLEERGHNVYIYYPGEGSYTPKEREYPFKSVGLNFYKGYRFAMPLNISDETKHLDIIHEHGVVGMAVAGLLAARTHKIPKILTFHTPIDEYTQYLTSNRILIWVLKGMYRPWERILLNSFDLVTTASQAIRERLEGNGVRDVEVLSNGIDLSQFYRVDGSGFRREYGIEDSKVIGFCGRLSYEKHVEDLINAADRFNGTILIAGKGPAEEYYKKLAEGKRNVKVLGFLNRNTLREFYSTLDVFVFPSVAETQGLVALESMAAGVPVVGVPVLALKNTITNGVTGYHYARGNIDELLQKIEECYKNKSILSKNCLMEAERNSVEKSIDRLEEIYSGLSTRRMTFKPT
ncbi:MAG: glycosyltransferase [Candidatus Altiarchaeota archaeon]